MLTAPFNVAGNPALAVPIGFTAAGLPLSMQVAGRAFDEQTVFRIAAAYEAASGATLRRPDAALWSVRTRLAEPPPPAQTIRRLRPLPPRGPP